MRKSLAAGAVSASLLAGGAAGALLFTPTVSGAQSTTTEAPTPAPASPNQDPGTAPQWMTDALNQLVTDGTLTQAQADAVAQALAAAKPARGPGGDHGRGGRGHGPGPGLDAAASAIGVSVEDLRSALKEGQSLAAVAQAHGVDPQKVIEAVASEMNQHLDGALAQGKMTQAEVDEAKAKVNERATAMVNGTAPMGRPGR